MYVLSFREDFERADISVKMSRSAAVRQMQSYKVTRTAIKDQKSLLTTPVGRFVSAAGGSGSSHCGERVMKLEKGCWDNDVAGGPNRAALVSSC